MSIVYVGWVLFVFVGTVHAHLLFIVYRCHPLGVLFLGIAPWESRVLESLLGIHRYWHLLLGVYCFA